MVALLKKSLQSIFFPSNLSIIDNDNIIYSSRKLVDELQAFNLDETTHLLEIGELKTCKGENQIGTLKRDGDTRWMLMLFLYL